MDLATETAIKTLMGKSLTPSHNNGGTESGSGFLTNGGGGSSNYITEKLYMLLQLYLQNKGWNPSSELLQCFTELKEASMLPSATYLQMLASRVSLDSQGRLILRENGKIILPYEHFANAIMLKHMNGPHGLHLNLDQTMRAMVESYTIGRENFGMDKEFIMEVVQNCPSPTCRFYKAQFDLSQNNIKPTYIPELQQSNSSTPQPTNGDSNSFKCASQTPSRPPSVDLTPVFELASNKLPEVFQGKSKPLTQRQQQQNKLADFLKANMENMDGLTADQDMMSPEEIKKQEVGQEKIIRAFGEIMKNMGRMKSCVRPAMCKPYGKQSESLQKTVIDTIQLVQSLRSFLPPPHIAVSSWKNEDKHGRLERKLAGNFTVNNNNNNLGTTSSTSSTVTANNVVNASSVATTPTTNSEDAK